MADSNNIYHSVTTKILEDLKQGIRPWHKPWNSGMSGMPLRQNSQPYSGINILILWDRTFRAGFSSPYWMTYKQAKFQNAFVKKGEKATQIVYTSSFTTIEVDHDGNEKEVQIPFLKTYAVFNADQIEGLPAAYASAPPLNSHQKLNNDLELMLVNTNADIRHGGQRAFYQASQDFIQVPNKSQFDSMESYYGTLLHELTHWTGHQSRLNRFGEKTNRRDSGYAFEELIAELGSAFLLSKFNLAPTPRRDHADYIASWLTLLEDDEKAIFKAAAMAQKAVEWLK